MFDNAFDPDNDQYKNRGFSDADLPEKPCALKRYSTRTLVGNWFEDRYTVIDKHCILPGMYGISHCQNDPCTYRLSYKPPTSNRTQLRALAGDFIELKQIAFENRTHCERSRLKLHHGDEFLNNMTTSFDLHYRLRPLQISRLDTRFCFELPEDSLDSHGNTTGYGLVVGKKCERIAESRRRYDVSVTKESYLPKCRVKEKDKIDEEIDEFLLKKKQEGYKHRMAALAIAQQDAKCNKVRRGEGVFQEEEEEKRQRTGEYEQCGE